jgi:exodeoxyribonuclease VII large subunit
MRDARTQRDFTPGKRIYSVSQFSSEVRRLLEASYPDLWIEGEISNLSNPQSGHSYFSIKDQNSQIRCALFRQRKNACAVKPVEGAQVLMHAKVSLYQARGDFQLIVDYMEDAGEGALRRAMEILKRQLESEGLFDSGRKQAIPKVPSRIGIITSATGAAIRDTLITLKQTASYLPIVIYPVLVQGNDAPASIVNALKVAEQRDECDLLLLIRGGGSLEDLQAFNDESVARGIFACPIPIVCGVGHETDTTIADFVADHRAATPTAAARVVSSATEAIELRLDNLHATLLRQIDRRLNNAMQQIDNLNARLRHPLERIRHHSTRLEHLQVRFKASITNIVSWAGVDVDGAARRLANVSPTLTVSTNRMRVQHLQERLQHNTDARTQNLQLAVLSLQKQLQHLDPSHTLARGYSVLTDRSGKRIITSIAGLTSGDGVNAKLADGNIDCQVQQVNPE